MELPILAQAAALELFNVLPGEASALDATYAAEGFVTNFKPTCSQLALLRETFKPIDLTTLFSVSEAKQDLERLFIKQLLHHFEIYNLGMPGLFNLEVEGGKTAALRFVKAVSVEELKALVSRLMYANAPLGDVKPVVSLVHALGIQYEFNKLANRELRIALFNPETDVLESGDDAVRWLCWSATGNPLLIKDQATIGAVTNFASTPEHWDLICAFLGAHTKELAQVFNRHRRLLIPLKEAGAEAKRLVNRVSRLSKELHVPVGTPASKTVITRAARGERIDLDRVSLQDKFRYLNLIEYKLLSLSTDAFAIRNGKLWTALDRPVLDPHRLVDLKVQVLEALKADLLPLRTERILLDPHVDYGLPISRKQSLGNLPFGTSLRVPSDRKISVGIYWRNEWGAPDLDLSAISADGHRIGWGCRESYARDDFLFSGDLTDATHGACEFFTVDPKLKGTRGLLVNIYYGNATAGAEIIVGYPTISEVGLERDASKIVESWQGRTLLRERITLKSRETLIGFARGDRFVIYSGRLGSSRVSNGEQPVIARGLSDLWTVPRLFDAVGVQFDTELQVGVRYTHDLRYESFSLDKLERVFEFGEGSSLQHG